MRYAALRGILVPSVFNSYVILNQVFLGRQPILDRFERLVAYELLFRSGSDNACAVVDNTAATTQVIHHMMGQIGMGVVLGPHRGFINVDEALLKSELIDHLSPRRVALELLECVEPSPGLLQRCRELRRMGFTIALDDFVFSEQRLPLVSVADIVKIDLMEHDVANLEATVARLRRWPVKLLAEKVENESMARYCLELGFDLFQGYYFARPSVLRARRQDVGITALVKLLELLYLDAEIRELEKVFKRNPDLTVKLLCLANSAAAGLSSRISSVTQALLFTGRRQLQRWLQLMLFITDPTRPHPSALMQLAVSRARLMELLVERECPGDRALADRAFMTGLLSLADVLLGWSREEVANELSVAQDVADALTHQQGWLGHMLRLACHVENDERDQAVALLVGFERLSLNALTRAHLEALAWMNQVSDTMAVVARGAPE